MPLTRRAKARRPLPAGERWSKRLSRAWLSAASALRANAKGPRGALLFIASRVGATLLDLGLAELDVLLGDRVVLLLRELVGHGARVLLGHVIVAGVGARHELDLDGDGLGHGNPHEFSGDAEPSVGTLKVKASLLRL